MVTTRSPGSIYLTKTPEEEEASRPEQAGKHKEVIKLEDVSEHLEPCPGDKRLKV